MMAKLFILLPVHNRREITRGFVECLKGQTFQDYHLLLIDDGSTDGTAEMVKQNIPSVTVLHGTGHWWWAGSLQQGINWLSRQMIGDDQALLIINDDVSIKEDFVEKGVGLLEKSTGTLMQARIYDKKSNELLDAGMVFDGKTLLFKRCNDNEEINCLTTNGLFMRWGDLRRIGDFYPKLLPHYLSDYEFTIRAHAKGLRLISPEGLRLYWNKETTGHREFDPDLTLVEFLKSYFSNRYAMNPAHWTAFILFGKYVQRRPYHLLRVWKDAGVAIFRKAISSGKKYLSGRP
jgi:GT2 family glycosyltransferase